MRKICCHRGWDCGVEAMRGGRGYMVGDATAFGSREKPLDYAYGCWIACFYLNWREEGGLPDAILPRLGGTRKGGFCFHVYFRSGFSPFMIVRVDGRL